MNEKLLKKLATKELEERQKEVIPDVLKQCFDKQLEFINDLAKRKALCCSRRSGKSQTAAMYLVSHAVNTIKGKFIYVGLTNKSAKDVMWQDLIQNICLKYGIQAEFIESKQEIRFKNGATIYLVGCDATPKQMERLRGNKYGLAIVDEAQSFTQDLRILINNVLGMTLAETNSTLCVLGTPGQEHSIFNYWFAINMPNSAEKDWKIFNWNWKDNPYVVEAIQKEVNNMIANNPLVINTPAFKMEILGEWVIESSNRVYRSTVDNYNSQLPFNFLNGCKYILSIDLGYYDATAFVIGAYNTKINSNLYILESFKKRELIISEVAGIIKELQKKYAFAHYIVDAANTQAVEELRKVHSIPLEAADKAGKEAHIAALNSDFITQNVCIINNANADLIKELELLTWDQRAMLQGKRKESASKDNHLTDALLYCHHDSRAYYFKPAEPIVSRNSNQFMMDEIEKQYGKTNTVKQIKMPFWNTEQ